MKSRERTGWLAVGALALLCFAADARGQCRRWLSPGHLDNDNFGHAAAIGGELAVVGAPYAESLSGVAWVLRPEGSGWALAQELRPSDGPEYKLFGNDVASDGARILVGAPHDAVGGLVRSGSAYVFAWDGQAWSEEAKLTPSDPDEDASFGEAVDIAGDTLAIGAGHVGGGTGPGAVYVFVRTGGAWVEAQKLTPSDPSPGAWFGAALDLGTDAQTLAVGCPYADAHGLNNPGAVYLFERDAAGWYETQRLEAHDPWHGAFVGLSVALDGGRLVAGAPDWYAFTPGAAYVFEREASGWVQTGKLVPSDAVPGDQVGRAVALSGDRLAVSAPTAPGGLGSGAVQLYARKPGGWVQGSRLTDQGLGCANNAYGSSLALGSHVLVGAVGYLGCTGWLYTYALDCVFGFWPYGACAADAPCDNPDPRAGCANSTGVGATLRAGASGTNSVTADDLELELAQLPPHQSALIYMGAERDLALFGDGQRLARPGPPGFQYHRFPVRNAGVEGVVREGPGLVAWSRAHFPGGAIVAGSTWHFQGYYRDPQGPCGHRFNLSDALSVQFAP